MIEVNATKQPTGQKPGQRGTQQNCTPDSTPDRPGQGVVLNRTAPRTGPDRNLWQRGQDGGQGTPRRGGPCPPPMLRGVELVRAGQMLGVLAKIQKHGFDGDVLESQIQAATLGKPYDKSLILSEVQRCSEWCHGLTGDALESVTRTVFPDAS